MDNSNNSLGFEGGSCPSAWFGGGQQSGQVYGFLLVANFSRDRSLLYNFLNESAVINVTSAGIIVGDFRVPIIVVSEGFVGIPYEKCGSPSGHGWWRDIQTCHAYWGRWRGSKGCSGLTDLSWKRVLALSMKMMMIMMMMIIIIMMLMSFLFHQPPHLSSWNLHQTIHTLPRSCSPPSVVLLHMRMLQRCKWRRTTPKIPSIIPYCIGWYHKCQQFIHLYWCILFKTKSKNFIKLGMRLVKSQFFHDGIPL